MKISVMVDALGNLVRFVPLPGQRHDLIGVPPLLEGVEFEALIADKAYDSNDFRAELGVRAATAVIPPRSNRVEAIDYDTEMYEWRRPGGEFLLQAQAFSSSCGAFREDRRQLRRDDPRGEFSPGTRLNVHMPLSPTLLASSTQSRLSRRTGAPFQSP